MASQWDGITERRNGTDRRKKGIWWLITTLKYQKRRRYVRRAEDRKRIVLLDHYSGSVVMLLIMILLLSVTDALLTLFLIEHGATELNPVMNYYLKKGPPSFIIVKYLLTASSAMLLVMSHYATFPFINTRNRSLLKVFAAGFMAVVAWEIYLIIGIVM